MGSECRAYAMRHRRLLLHLHCDLIILRYLLRAVEAQLKRLANSSAYSLASSNINAKHAHLLLHDLLPAHILQRQLRHIGFLLLDLVQLHLDRIVNHELDGCYRPSLTHTMLRYQLHYF